MLLTITYTGKNTPELGYLLYKNPSRPQVTELSYGRAYVFYPEVSERRTTAALLLDIDPIDLARGKEGVAGGGLFDYVNDRPYVSSSFISTAISKVYGTAMSGRADDHQALSDSPLDLTATVTMLPCRGDQEKLRAVFEPLGYEVTYESFAADENFPDWGESVYVNLTIKGKVRLRDLLKHLYVLIPVFDRQKHYWVGEEEIEKLLRLGEDWLPNHPEKGYITARYLSRRRSLINIAFAKLAEGIEDGEGQADENEAEAPDETSTEAPDETSTEAPDETPAEAPDETPAEAPDETPAEPPDKKQPLNTVRLNQVVAALKACGARRVIDLGCGEGRLITLLVKDRQFTQIAGVDLSHTALKRATRKLNLDRGGDSLRERVKLFLGSLTYKDARFSGYDAACVVEVIEHLDLPRLAALERGLFEFAKPPVVILTTPNKEYNAKYGFIDENDLRHSDHRFEWTRDEFRGWAAKTAEKFGYEAQFSEIGELDETCGAPTQMGVFTLCE